MKKYTKDSALRRIRKFSGYMNVHREENRAGKSRSLLMLGGAMLTGFVAKQLLKGANTPQRRKNPLSARHGRGGHGAILDRDQPGPVSVSSEEQGHPSYTYNADKSAPYDPHLSEENPPDRAPAPQNTEDDALDRDKPGPLSVSSRDRVDSRDTHAESAHAGERKSEDVLDRDQPGPVSVSSEEQGHPSYTYNADKSAPYDPHLSEENSPGRAPAPQNPEDDALDRDKRSPLSVKGDKSPR